MTPRTEPTTAAKTVTARSAGSSKTRSARIYLLLPERASRKSRRATADAMKRAGPGVNHEAAERSFRRLKSVEELGLSAASGIALRQPRNTSRTSDGQRWRGG